MIESYLILSYICLIIALQSIVGVGVLVLGTPLLLLLNYNIIEIFFILLPLSIITSLINLILIKITNKKLTFITSKGLKKFLIACIPSIIVGLLILKYFQEYINFKTLVSVVIIFSLVIIYFKDKIKFRINFFRFSILSIIGIIHGITNSGGTLMSLVLSSENKKLNARLIITLFYLFLAIIQYFITYIIFYDLFFFPFNMELIIALFFGFFFGNVFLNFLSERKYKILINILALSSSIFLLL
tara:strand:- start:540 stop:1268 length:729 start_codon:yes stop_codon:yes gene_type:complete